MNTNIAARAAGWLAAGRHFLASRQPEKAVECLSRGLEIAPGDPILHALRARSRKALRQPERARDDFRAALKQAPDNPDILYDFALFEQQQGNLAAAERLYLRLLERAPDYADGLANLGRLYQDSNQPRKALRYYRRDLELRPDDPDSHFSLAFILLQLGNYEEGWREFEWRFRREAARRTYPHSYPQPRWQGEDFAGRTLLVHCEQGYGDTLQFIRYLPLVKERGGRVLLETPAPLAPLLESYPGIDELLIFNPETPCQATFDIVIPLLSLPLIFGTTPENIPGYRSRLRAGPARRQQWQELATNREKLQVGLVWRGKPRPDPLRSCPARELAPLCTEVAGISIYGLQSDPAPGEMELLASCSNFAGNLGPRLRDFADTAAVMEQLDLIISIDTAAAHLAGALGRKTWLLLPYTPDWRWFLERQDSPWYPTMTLFRQPRPGDWQTPLTAIRRRLEQLTA